MGRANHPFLSSKLLTGSTGFTELKSPPPKSNPVDPVNPVNETHSPHLPKSFLSPTKTRFLMWPANAPHVASHRPRTGQSVFVKWPPMSFGVISPQSWRQYYPEMTPILPSNDAKTRSWSLTLPSLVTDTAFLVTATPLLVTGRSRPSQHSTQQTALSYSFSSFIFLSALTRHLRRKHPLEIVQGL